MNYIAKMVNGKPQIFATTQKDNGAPVYIFTEKETFDAAIADHLIPVGALIVKTYDAIEIAGGPFDAELSTESENAPQNKAVAIKIKNFENFLTSLSQKIEGTILQNPQFETSTGTEIAQITIPVDGTYIIFARAALSGRSSVPTGAPADIMVQGNIISGAGTVNNTGDYNWDKETIVAVHRGEATLKMNATPYMNVDGINLQCELICAIRIA